MKSLHTIAVILILYASPIQTAKAAESKVNEAKEQDVYIPKDLDDAVHELNRLFSKEDKEQIAKGEIGANYMHLGTGMGLRNSWGLWKGSRLKTYFKERGITHPDTMSSFCLEAFCRNLRGEKYSLLDIAKGPPKQSDHIGWLAGPIFKNGQLVEGKHYAVLYSRVHIDKKERLFYVSLYWHPDDANIYFERMSKASSFDDSEYRRATDEEIKELKKDTEHWNASDDELRILSKIFRMTKDERLAFILTLDEKSRHRLDGILPRTKDPKGLDKAIDPFDDTK